MTVSSTDQGAAPEEAAPTSDVTPAAPSTAEPGASSLLDAVSAALKGPEDSPASEVGSDKPEPTTAQPTAPEKVAAPEQSDDLTDEDKKLPRPTQHRVQQLLNQRKELRAEREAITREIESLRPKAQTADRLTGFMQTHGISGQEVDNTLEITRLIKTGDFSKAEAVLKPIWEELQRRIGNVLPDDLQQRVRLGYISEKDARDLHKAKLTAAQVESQSRDRQKREATANQQRQFSATLNEGIQALDGWYSAKAQSDPDWNLKQQDVADEFERLVLRHRSIPTRQQAIQFAEQALQAVDARLKRYAPKPAAVRTPTGQFASPTSKPAAPASILDAVKRGLGVA